MANIGKGKFGGTTSNSFGNGRMLLGPKFGYSRKANTSLLGNSFTRMASFKQRKNGILLSGGEGFDHGGGWE
jgi:hypothetical protein